MTHKTDKRVERTRNAILKAFKEMIIEKDFNDITIKELAQRANINRKTFYLHYESMEEILFDLSLELSDKIVASLLRRDFFKAEKDLDQFNILIDAISETINSDYPLASKLITNDSYHFFSRDIKNLVKDYFINKIKTKTDLDETSLNLIGDYIASGLAKLLKEWFKNPGDLSVNDIATLASKIIYNGISAFSK